MKINVEWRDINIDSLKGRYILSNEGHVFRIPSLSKVPRHTDNEGERFFMMVVAGESQPFMLDELLFRTFGTRACDVLNPRKSKYDGVGHILHVPKSKEPYSENEEDYAREENIASWGYMVEELKRNYRIMRMIKENESFEDPNLESF